MALSKQFLKSRPVCKVKFAVSKDTANGGGTVFVVGDFNNWSETASPMKKQKDGSHALTMELKTGKDYRFRYLSNGHWYNEAEADRFEFCSYSAEDNSVISV